jgi:hypothetical protein
MDETHLSKCQTTKKQQENKDWGDMWGADIVPKNHGFFCHLDR